MITFRKESRRGDRETIGSKVTKRCELRTLSQVSIAERWSKTRLSRRPTLSLQARNVPSATALETHVYKMALASQYIFAFTGPDTTDLERLNSLARCGPLKVALDQKVAVMLPGAVDTTSFAFPTVQSRDTCHSLLHPGHHNVQQRRQPMTDDESKRARRQV